MKWNLLSKNKDPEKIIEILLNNRGIKGTRERSEFLNPVAPTELDLVKFGADKKQITKSINRVTEAIKSKEPIVVYGDYDVDGICSTAILWETIKGLGGQVMPFIPQREKEGYGLSVEGIKTIFSEDKYGFSKRGKSQGLLITVDNGIVAHEAIDFAKGQGLDVIIVDHHEIGKTLPSAFAIVHSLELCAGGISYLFSRLLNNQTPDDKLELAAIATVADLVPLVGPNRSIVKFGLQNLNETKRVGLKAIFEVAGIKSVGTYEIGYLIGPRINASGRIENALTALRLLCTKDPNKAREYAELLNETNKERQAMTLEMATHAIEVQSSKLRVKNSEGKVIIIEDESYHQGVIGLIAGKLVEKYYLPAIVIAKGPQISKASARSISGFNIIEAIRTCSSLLINAGGHPMAAGFSIETIRIEEFKTKMLVHAARFVTTEMLERTLRVDTEIGLETIGMEFFSELSKLSPHGIGNPEPVFASEVKVQSIRTVGADGKHLKLVVKPVEKSEGLSKSFDAIAFGMGDRLGKIKEGDKISIAYSLALDTYNGGNKLQFKVKDII